MKPEEIAFEEECQRKSLAFRAERFSSSSTLLYFCRIIAIELWPPFIFYLI